MFQARYVTGPLVSRVKPGEPPSSLGQVRCRLRSPSPDLIGRIRVQDLTTKDIRVWHRRITEEVSVYSANKALMILKSAMALAAEDHEFRPPAIPIGLQRRPERPRKLVLTPEQVSQVLCGAKKDTETGVYYAAPFLMGTRPSEQLGLLWDEVDFEK